MSNIELRKVKRVSKVDKGGVVEVLQYRTKTKHVDSPTTEAISKRWNAWVDVPIEDEFI